MSPSTTSLSLLRKPGAWLPMAMSVAALALMLAYVARFGVGHAQDEGLAARMFQLFMVVQAIAIASFGLRWLSQAPKAAATVIALQIVLAATPIALITALEAQVR